MAPDIKIFVSHRIDINSELIDNPLYVPVRCGAVFDQENPMGILGDDTGDNISERRMSFCEFTVQYWAWKNSAADYYGLCHYRRYLSFSEKHLRTDEYNMIHRPFLTPREKKRLGLLNSERMVKVISENDVVVSEYADVSKIPTPQGKMKIVKELWDAHEGEFFKKTPTDWLLSQIDEKAPAFSESARAYFAGTRHRGFNCYVMRKELFERLCEFQFPIMFEAERQMDLSGCTQMMQRLPAFIGEMLYGIFIYHLETCEDWRIQEVQLAFFVNTDRIEGRVGLFLRYVGYSLDKVARSLIDPVMPKGTRRREMLKDIFYAVTPAKRRGAARIK